MNNITEPNKKSRYARRLEIEMERGGPEAVAAFKKRNALKSSLAARKKLEEAKKDPEKYRALRDKKNARNRLDYRNSRLLYTARIKKWQDKNLDKRRAYVNARRRAVKLSFHPLADKKAIRAIYVEAQRLTRETGIPHSVDHIIPLSSGGWSHELNLQVLPNHINSQKNDNPFWTHPDYMSWNEVPRWLWPDRLFRRFQAKIAA